MPGFPRLAATVAALVLLPLGLASCATPRGVEVYNDTGQIIRAEMMTVNVRGETATYSTGIVNAEGIFEHRMTAPVQGQTMRVRFTMADQPPDDVNWVMLKLSDTTTRTYSLQLDNGRLRAMEATSRKPREQ